MNNGIDQHVIFGAGPVGLAVMDELVRHGAAVRVVSRSGAANVPPGVTALRGDVADADFIHEACRGATVAYNCLNAPYDKWPAMFPPLQQAVLHAARDAGAKLIVMENVYMYGPSRAAPLTEDTPYAPQGRKGAIRAQMSRDLLAAPARGDVRVAIGRASDFFGPRVLESTMGERVLRPALAGKGAQMIGDVSQPHSYTYVPDIGHALVTLGAHDKALGRAWHVPNAPAVTSRRFLELIFAETGHPVKISVPPTIALRALSLAVPMIREVMEMSYEFEEPFIVDDTQFRAAFGGDATPLARSIPATVAWFREHPASK